MEATAITEAVSDRTNADEDAATEATRAVLMTLGERLSEDQARDLAAQLPDEFAEHLTAGQSGQRFPEEEFVSRVDQRIETPELTGERAAVSVVGTVLEAVDESERAAVVDQFQHYGFDELLAETNADVDVADRSPRE